MNNGKGNYNQGHVKNNLCSLNFVIVCRLNKKTVYNYDFFVNTVKKLYIV